MYFLTMKNEKITIRYSAKFVGLVLNHQLPRNLHIKHVTVKIYEQISLIYKLRLM